MQVGVGNIVEGKVAGITNFGAFIQLPEGKTGLVHISEIAEEYVKDIKNHLYENQEVRVKILSMDKGKISLSIKKAMEHEKSVKQSIVRDEPALGHTGNSGDCKNNIAFKNELATEDGMGFNKGNMDPKNNASLLKGKGAESYGNNNFAGITFEDRLAKYLKDSNERMHDLKKSFEPRRSGRGYRRSSQYY